MRTTHSTHRRATTAIAAVLALTSTPLLAQEAATPPLDGPIVAAPPATTTVTPPAPVLVIPDVSTVEAQPAPADPVAGTSTTNTTRATAPQPQTRTTARATASQPAARATTVAAPAAPVAEEPLTATEAEAPLPPVVPIDEPTDIQPTPEQATDITAVLGLVLVTLVGLVIAIFMFAALRRRRAAIAQTAPAPIEPPVVAPTRPVASVAEPAPFAEPIPAMRHAPSQALQANGAAVPLPARLPENYEERSALLQRMIDAKPDRANPFTDRKARMRRARLILQSLGRKFDGAKPWIDLTDYPENWPELSRQPRTTAAPTYTRELEPA